MSMEPPVASTVRGIGLAIGAGASFAMLDSIAKYLSASYPTPMIAWARYFFHVAVMLVVFLPALRGRLFVTRRPGLQIARGLCLGMSSITFFSALSMMPQAEATAIVAIAPVLASIAAIRWLGETAPPGTWLALAASFAGVLLIVRPGSALFGSAALLPLAAAFFGAGYAVLTRRLAGIDQGTTTLFLGGVVATLLLCAIVPMYWTAPRSAFDLLLLVCTGIIGAFGHLMLVRAYENASATTLAPFGYSHTVAALPLGWLLFDAVPHDMAVLGMMLIVGSGAAMAIIRAHHARRVPPR